MNASRSSLRLCVKPMRRGVAGKKITPYLLSKMSEMSEGRTLKANIALLENNARVAAEIASAVATALRL